MLSRRSFYAVRPDCVGPRLQGDDMLFDKSTEHREDPA